MIRVYQLKGRKVLIVQITRHCLRLIAGRSRPFWSRKRYPPSRPGAVIAMNIPLEESARYAAVAGIFMSPDQLHTTWRIVLERGDLGPDKARVTDAGENRLTLQKLKED